jgi:drug/metabolite transporter (DMT)-like permease
MGRGAMSTDTKVILLGLLNAALLTAGCGFQKLNGVKGGDPVFSKWILAAFACLAPTFFIGNLAFAIGGRASLFIAVTAVAYIWIAIMAWWLFGEPLGAQIVGGLVLIVAGVGLVVMAKPA